MKIFKYTYLFNLAEIFFTLLNVKKNHILVNCKPLHLVGIYSRLAYVAIAVSVLGAKFS